MRLILVVSLFFATATLTSCEQPYRVYRPEGERVRWPLTVDSGTIRCERPLSRPLVLFESEDRVYGVNGAAIGSAGYPSIRNIMVHRRLWGLVSPVAHEWVRAGIALCDGDEEEAKRRIRMANSLAAKPLPPGVERTLSVDPESVNKRRIFFESVMCEDIAMRTTNEAYYSRVDKLLKEGRRLEARRLNGEKFEKMDEEMMACKGKLREQEGLSASELTQIEYEGLAKYWPTPQGSAN